MRSWTTDCSLLSLTDTYAVADGIISLHSESIVTRILYIDCDSLRPDHLGCYGYDRETSPNID